ncbi:MAG: TonB family protein [Desulfobacterales bacterium]|nr:TonB family protein [Desulfobacterales bacterium]
MRQRSIDISLRGTWREWSGAVTFTLILNLGLFCLIPNLMKPSDTRPDFSPVIPQVRLVRLQPPKIEPKRVKTTPPAKTKENKTSASPRANRPAKLPLTLPFEINAALPGSPLALNLPQVMSESLNNLDLGSLFEPGDLDQPLTFLSRIPPVYPFRAKARGIEGWVSVGFTVTEQGLVDDIKVLEADPGGIFDQSVIQCLSSWRFTPGRIGGELVKTRVQTRILFELD